MVRTGGGARLSLLALAVAGLDCSTGQQGPPLNTGAGACSETAPLRCEGPCFAGDGAACFTFGQALGGMADAPVRLPQDLPRGERALKKGCQLGNLDACRELVSYETDRAAPGTDCAGWEDLCRRGNQRSCTFFGQCLDHSQHFRRDRRQALRLFEDGCARGERVACRELGLLALNGEGAAKDDARGFALLDQACRLDDPLACADQGLLLETGRGTARDLPRAKALYRMSCARGIRPIPCEALRRLGETPPSSAALSAEAVESVHSNAYLGYDLRLPADWRFVAPSGIPFSDAPTASEIVIAQPRSDASPSETLILAVGDDIEIIPGKARQQDPDVFDKLELKATQWLAGHGLTKLASVRTRFFSHDAVRVEARTVQPGARFLTMVLFREDRRWFEVRCLSGERPPDLPCAGAFGSLEIHEAAPPKPEVGRVLHLREPRVGLSFDAPDDHWLAFGPRLAFGGNQRVWFWVNDQGQIDVSVLEIGRQAEAGLAKVIGAAMAKQFQAGGASVTIDEAVLDKQRWVHLSIDGPLTDGTPGAEDLFLYARGKFSYSVLVTTAARNLHLLDRARAGVHLTPLP